MLHRRIPESIRSNRRDPTQPGVIRSHEMRGDMHAPACTAGAADTSKHRDPQFHHCCKGPSSQPERSAGCPHSSRHHRDEWDPTLPEAEQSRSSAARRMTRIEHDGLTQAFRVSHPYRSCLHDGWDVQLSHRRNPSTPCHSSTKSEDPLLTRHPPRSPGCAAQTAPHHPNVPGAPLNGPFTCDVIHPP